MPTTAKPTPSWRDVLPIHPAADLFPLMSPDELTARKLLLLPARDRRSSP